MGVMGLSVLNELPVAAAVEVPSTIVTATKLHLVGRASDGTIWHTIRFPDGTWVPNFGNVNNQEGNGGSLRFSGVGAGGLL